MKISCEKLKTLSCPVRRTAGTYGRWKCSSTKHYTNWAKNTQTVVKIHLRPVSSVAPNFTKLPNVEEHYIPISMTNFNTIRQENVAIQLRVSVQYDCQRDDFHETPARSTTLCQERLHRTVWKSIKVFSCWHWVTNVEDSISILGNPLHFVEKA